MRKEQRALWETLCLLRSDWSLRWLDVCICADASGKSCRLRFVEKATSWVRRWSCLRADKVQEKFHVHPCPVACDPFHRARCRFGIFTFGREGGVPCLKKKSHGLPWGVVATFGSLAMDIGGGVRWFLPRGKHHST